MNKGTVKWFNAEKVMVSSQEKTELMYSYIFLQSMVKASNLLKKARL